jgi:hypothetical protein
LFRHNYRCDACNFFSAPNSPSLSLVLDRDSLLAYFIHEGVWEELMDGDEAVGLA